MAKHATMASRAAGSLRSPGVASAAMHAHVHRGPLEPLLEGWARLHAGQPDATPFTSPGWAEAWWPHFATNAEPFLVVVREGDELIGLGALVRRRKGPLRILEPVGMEPGDYWDVLAAPARRADVGQAVGAELRRRCGEWDAWLLRCLPPGSPVEAAIDHAGLKVLALPPVTAPALVLPETFDAYLASLSSSHRQNLRRHLRLLDDGEVELREVTDSDALGPAIRRWHELRRRQWESAGREIRPRTLPLASAATNTGRWSQRMPATTRAIPNQAATVGRSPKMGTARIGTSIRPVPRATG